MRMLTHVVTEADAGRAVRSVVPRRFCLGQHAFRRLKLLGAIRVGGVPVRADYRLRAGEVITVLLPSEEGDAAPLPDALPGDLPPAVDAHVLQCHRAVFEGIAGQVGKGGGVGGLR